MVAVSDLKILLPKETGIVDDNAEILFSSSLVKPPSGPISIAHLLYLFMLFIKYACIIGKSLFISLQKNNP